MSSVGSVSLQGEFELSTDLAASRPLQTESPIRPAIVVNYQNALRASELCVAFAMIHQCKFHWVGRIVHSPSTLPLSVAFRGSTIRGIVFDDNLEAALHAAGSKVFT